MFLFFLPSPLILRKGRLQDSSWAKNPEDAISFQARHDSLLQPYHESFLHRNEWEKEKPDAGSHPEMLETDKKEEREKDNFRQNECHCYSKQVKFLIMDGLVTICINWCSTRKTHGNMFSLTHCFMGRQQVSQFDAINWNRHERSWSPGLGSCLILGLKCFLPAIQCIILLYADIS